MFLYAKKINFEQPTRKFVCYEQPRAVRNVIFEEEVVAPRFSIDNLYRQREEDLLNNKGQFFVQVTEKHPYVKEFVKQAQGLGLTVSGDGTSPVKGGDIRQVEKGDQITVGSSSRFDVNWTKRDQYFCQKGYAPVYDIVKDWNKIEKALKQFAAEKREIDTLDGSNIRFHSRFMVVNGRVVPYKKNEVLVVMPTQTLRDILVEYDLLTVKVLRNW